MKKALPILLIAGAGAVALGGGKKSGKKKSKSKSKGSSTDPDRGTDLPNITANIQSMPIKKSKARMSPERREYAGKAANNILAFAGYDGKRLEPRKLVEFARMVGNETFPGMKWPTSVAESDKICNKVVQDNTSVSDRDVIWCELIRIVDEASGYTPVI